MRLQLPQKTCHVGFTRASSVIFRYTNQRNTIVARLRHGAATVHIYPFGYTPTRRQPPAADFVRLGFGLRLIDTALRGS